MKKLSKENHVLYKFFYATDIADNFYFFCNAFLITVPIHSDVVTLCFGISDAVTRSVVLCNQPAQPNKFMSQHLVELYHTQDVATPSDA
jgi:hypothetical protein